jgi:hypothetical protein
MRGDKGERVEVTAYSGSRGEETPRSLVLKGVKVEVVEVVEAFIEEGPDRRRRRVFKVRGSDGGTYRVHFDETVKEWFPRGG